MRLRGSLLDFIFFFYFWVFTLILVFLVLTQRGLNSLPPRHRARRRRGRRRGGGQEDEEEEENRFRFSNIQPPLSYRLSRRLSVKALSSDLELDTGPGRDAPLFTLSRVSADPPLPPPPDTSSFHLVRGPDHSHILYAHRQRRATRSRKSSESRKWL